MYQRLLVFICKILIKLLRLIGKNGSALPGLIIERLSPTFLQNSLKPVEDKIILVTGTNGKTTSTKMLVAALRGVGHRVVTNSTGSNMTRGLVAALVEDMTYYGSLKSTDYFVFEMDEAYAPIFTKTISPRCVLALNVLRDQLDRYGEIDKTAGLIEAAASKSRLFIYNQLDPLLAKAAKSLKSKAMPVLSFGVSTQLKAQVANEQSLYSSNKSTSATTLADVSLKNAKEIGDIQEVAVEFKNTHHDLTIPIKGFHNALNATAVVAALVALDEKELNNALKALATMPTPFGRGEKLHFKTKNITVALVKNPSGFKSNLETFVKAAHPQPQLILFVINDKFADGRDVSWLWDVEFKSVIPSTITVMTSGIRAYDMALRLKQENIDVDITTNITKAIRGVMRSDYQNIVIIPTYTALFEVRAALGRYGKVPRIW